MAEAVRVSTSAASSDESAQRTSALPAATLNALMPLVFEELRSIAARALRRERADHTLHPTALVNEVYLRLCRGGGLSEGHWQSRAHFFGAAALAIRRILVEHARRRSAARRGGGATAHHLNAEAITDPADRTGGIDVLELESALEALGRLDPRLLHVAQLRLYGGLTMEEVAFITGRARRTVEQDWAVARAWLRRALASDGLVP